MNDERSQRTVNAVQISLDIIQYLQEHDGAGITEIAETLGYAKGTIHSHMTTLATNEYVVKQDGLYRLSLRYLDLAQTVRDRLQIYDAVREELEDLASESGELAQSATEEHGKAVYIYKTGGEKAVQTASSVGDREYLHCIALGKAMLAHKSRDRVEEIIDRHGLEGFTENTINSREELFSELETIRERGFAFDREEKIEGLRCVAAPIVTNGEIAGALSISGPASRFKGKVFEEELPEMVTRSANVVEINSKFS